MFSHVDMKYIGLLLHMNENYVNGSANHGPMFKPDEWLLSNRSPVIPRTNNFCEASNSIMNVRLISNFKNISIFKSCIKSIRGVCDGASLLQFFQNEEERVSTGASVAAINRSHRMSLPISKSIEKRNRAVATALSNPHNLRGFALLDHIACTLAPFQK